MLGGPGDLRGGGGGGGVTVTDLDDVDSGGSSGGSSSDPFGSGKTGSETLAEAGAPESVVTSDPHSSSMEEVIADKGLKGTFGKLTSLAHDGDDGPSATFDHVPNTEAGREALQDSAESIVETAQSMAESAGPSDMIPENVPAMDSDLLDQLPGGAVSVVVMITAVVVAVWRGR